VTATEGRTATHLRKVVRRTALAAAESDPEGDLKVDGDRLAAAAVELLDNSAGLTRSLLGAEDKAGDAEATFAPPPGAYVAQIGTRMVRMSHGGIGPIDHPNHSPLNKPSQHRSASLRVRPAS